MLNPAFKRCARILIVIFLIGVSTEAQAQISQANRVRVGLAGRNFSFLSFFVAEQQKFFEQEGI